MKYKIDGDETDDPEEAVVLAIREVVDNGSFRTWRDVADKVRERAEEDDAGASLEEFLSWF